LLIHERKRCGINKRERFQQKFSLRRWRILEKVEIHQQMIDMRSFVAADVAIQIKIATRRLAKTMIAIGA
jgi:hypothetical protein